MMEAWMDFGLEIFGVAILYWLIVLGKILYEDYLNEERKYQMRELKRMEEDKKRQARLKMKV